VNRCVNRHGTTFRIRTCALFRKTAHLENGMQATLMTRKAQIKASTGLRMS
jgi:hypothetical protein